MMTPEGREKWRAAVRKSNWKPASGGLPSYSWGHLHGEGAHHPNAWGPDGPVGARPDQPRDARGRFVVTPEEAARLKKSVEASGREHQAFGPRTPISRDKTLIVPP